MTDQGSLFDPPPWRTVETPAAASGAQPQAEPDSTLSVSRLNRLIEMSLVEAFPQEVWVRGEIQGFDRGGRSPHRYFELVEKDQTGDRPRARIAVVLFDRDRRARILPTLRQNPEFQLQDNIEVRMRCRVRYWAQGGRLQLQMVGIDPMFTLGQLAANRERILRSLRADGLLDRNARLEVPRLPLRLGLITSLGSAAYNDVVRELTNSGYGFAVSCIDVRVQGPLAEPNMVSAMAHFRRNPPDLVLLVRGGGSRSDLAAFDGERLARSIAAMPVPVWVGVGHEIDRTVADEVAHSTWITPTACATEVVQWVGQTVAFLERASDALRRHVPEQLTRAESSLTELARAVTRSTQAGLQRQSTRLLQRSVDLRREAGRSLERRQSELHRTWERVEASGQLRLTERAGQLERLRAGLRPSRWLAPLEAARADLDRAQDRVVRTSNATLQTMTSKLDLMVSRVAAVDPERALARGFTLTYDAHGNLVRSVDAIKPGDHLVTRVADGNVVSRVSPDPTEEA